jgi:hypothetical protein
MRHAILYSHVDGPFQDTYIFPPIPRHLSRHRSALPCELERGCHEPKSCAHELELAMSTNSASSTMAVNLPSVPRAYQDQMTTQAQGLALWDPNPLKVIYDKVSIGDVGYLHEGSFIRMFNVMLPWNHESLDCGPFTNIFKRQFDKVKHYSRSVSAEANAGNGDGQATTPDE